MENSAYVNVKLSHFNHVITNFVLNTCNVYFHESKACEIMMK